MEFDYSKLLGKIKECYGTQEKFAVALGLGRAVLNKRLNNHLDFSRPEMLKACSLLGISYIDITDYFFTEKVQKHELTSPLNHSTALPLNN